MTVAWEMPDGVAAGCPPVGGDVGVLGWGVDATGGGVVGAGGTTAARSVGRLSGDPAREVNAAESSPMLW